ncbi:TetR/AcrR family transcriptional regulator [Bifidobacterium platyrrhinorum]|uniref:TetR family transcriptional regulator n=1 Tax=Bifidobacterium platyrrhinorum TaxID=2661628 RepID=A0A6L9STH4_9BIFI|nr:TetR family transcriptional regulator [Bifidobacterium platyrrhinorum]NEG55870.1 TetR family transcriptional regulator [Bifidobacterium platyrrhinorum]
MTPEQRREQIAREATRLIAQYGSYGLSMQLLADAVGMTVPGLNHYVSSREEVLSLVIETYYDMDTGTYAPIPEDRTGNGNGDDGTAGTKRPISLPACLRSLVAANAERPQMVALFMQLAIEASDPKHPAHAFYRDRHRTILERMMRADWDLPDVYRDPEMLHDLVATVFFAMDGVQVQAMTNPDESMTDLWARAERVLFPSPIWDGHR